MGNTSPKHIPAGTRSFHVEGTHIPTFLGPIPPFNQNETYNSSAVGADGCDVRGPLSGGPKVSIFNFVKASLISPLLHQKNKNTSQRKRDVS